MMIEHQNGLYRGPEGHRSLGYCGQGNYKCSCGLIFETDQGEPFKVAEVGEVSLGFQAVKNRWRAHQREVEAK